MSRAQNQVKMSNHVESLINASIQTAKELAVNDFQDAVEFLAKRLEGYKVNSNTDRFDFSKPCSEIAAEILKG